MFIRAIGEDLAMLQLHFNTEVRNLKDLRLEAAPVSEPELKLAQQFIS